MIRDTKFRKVSMIALHPSTQIALNVNLATRRREETPDGHLFVIAPEDAIQKLRGNYVPQASLRRGSQTRRSA